MAKNDRKEREHFAAGRIACVRPLDATNSLNAFVASDDSAKRLAKFLCPGIHHLGKVLRPSRLGSRTESA
jgi:hypothetical protein